jgi:hypothetical protein
MAGQGVAYDIPMSAKLNVVDVPAALSRGMDLEQKQIETDEIKQNFADQQNDKKVLTDYTSQGGDLYTQDGIAKAKSDLRGKVSFKTYDQIGLQEQKLKQHDIDMREKIANFSATETKAFLDKNNAVLGSLVPITEAYKIDETSKGKQEAEANFATNKAAKLKELAAAKDSSGQPLFTPEQIQTFGQMDYPHLAAAVTVSKPYHDMAEAKWKQSQTAENEALAKKNAALAEKAKNMPESDKLHLRELEALHTQGLISDDLYAKTKEGLLSKATGGATSGGPSFTEAGQKLFDSMVASGNTPAGAFRSKNPSPILVDTINRLAETAADPNTDKAAFAADNASLRKLVPSYDAVKAFEENTAQQGQVLKTLAKKVDKTGVPVVERWIRAGRRQVEGDEDVSEFNAQLQLYASEAAKILTNPNLSGQLSDTARAEVKAFLPDSATSGQIDRVVDRLTNDFSLREKSLEDQIDKIKSRMSDRSKKASTPRVDPKAQQSRDSDAVSILESERDETADKLTGEKDPTKRARIESDVAALDRELVAARKKAGVGGGKTPAESKKKVYDPATGTFK